MMSRNDSRNGPLGSPLTTLDIARPRLPDADQILPYLRRIDDARQYANFGPLNSELEQRLADRFEAVTGAVTGVVTGANATQLLTITLRALQPVPGAVCLLPSWTFVATAHAVLDAGYTPWFVDVSAETGAMTPACVAAALAEVSGPVGCVMPVMPFGAPIDVDAWAAFRDETGIPVVIDGAAGFDTARRADVPVVVSLHATKVIGAGEGGFLASSDLNLLADVRQRSNFGFRGTRAAEVCATNAKLSEYGAAVALAAMDGWDASRLRWLLAATRLRTALRDIPGIRFQAGWGVTWVSSTCVVRLDPALRSELGGVFAAHGISQRNWWGSGCHQEAAFRNCARTALPQTEAWAQTSVGLPFHPDLSDGDATRIGGALKDAAARVGGREIG